jgi:hypothetical protein
LFTSNLQKLARFFLTQTKDKNLSFKVGLNKLTYYLSILFGMLKICPVCNLESGLLLHSTMETYVNFKSEKIYLQWIFRFARKT